LRSRIPGNASGAGISDRQDAFYYRISTLRRRCRARFTVSHASGSLVQGLVAQAMGNVSSSRSQSTNLCGGHGAPCENLYLTLGDRGPCLAPARCWIRFRVPIRQRRRLRKFGDQRLLGLWGKIEECADSGMPRDLVFRSGARLGRDALCHDGLVSLLGAPYLPGSRAPGPARPACDHSGRRARWTWRIRGRHRRGRTEPHAKLVQRQRRFRSPLDGRRIKCWEPRSTACSRKSRLDAWETIADGSLCCGFAGQAYASLNLYKHTDDKTWLHRAQGQAQEQARSMRRRRWWRKQRAMDKLVQGGLGVRLAAADLENAGFARCPFLKGRHESLSGATRETGALTFRLRRGHPTLPNRALRRAEHSRRHRRVRLAA